MIGKEGKLFWYLFNDLKFFKEKIIYNILVLGCVIFEGMGCCLLLNWIMIVFISNLDY